MSIELSLPVSDSVYRRRFNAEIDVLTENEILVRGRMSDHRFAFEHMWKVRTPDYEVIEASASQSEADPAEFDPELCRRYAGIKGVRIGRGFSKRITSELGDLPGNREHLLCSIEMARIGQQIYQYTPEFEAQFPAADSKSNPADAAKIAWLKDRAYMTDLANSCYAYRDQSAELFKIREVRCGFSTDNTRPKPGDKRAFWRDKELEIIVAESADGSRLYSCESRMQDSIHDIKVHFEIASDGVISNASSRGLRLPYHGICEDAQMRTPILNGMKITGGFVKTFADAIGGAQGCTHLFDLSIDCLRLFRFE